LRSYKRRHEDLLECEDETISDDEKTQERNKTLEDIIADTKTGIPALSEEKAR